MRMCSQCLEKRISMQTEHYGLHEVGVILVGSNFDAVQKLVPFLGGHLGLAEALSRGSMRRRFSRHAEQPSYVSCSEPQRSRLSLSQHPTLHFHRASCQHFSISHLKISSLQNFKPCTLTRKPCTTANGLVRLGRPRSRACSKTASNKPTCLAQNNSRLVATCSLDVVDHHQRRQY